MWYRYLILLGIVLGLLTVLHLLIPRPRIASAHVINMDESRDRLAEFVSNATAAGLSVERWGAVDSRAMKETDLAPLQLSKYIWKWAAEHKKLGMLGCYLSHRTLLKHLEGLPVNSNDVHLVFEDDAYVPPDFMAQWNSLLDQAPPDWDILQLGVTFPNLRQVSGRVHRHLHDKGNGGTFAYAVRHNALRKINAHIAYMTDPIDIMLRNKWRDWNYYIAWPELCPHNDHGESVIVQ